MRRILAAGLGLALALSAGAAAAQKKELGLNVHQSSTTGIDVAAGAGVGWVRIDFNWLDVEKTQGQYDWAVMDAIVAAAGQKKLSILAVIGYTPAWASQANLKADASSNDVPKAGLYPAFVTKAVSRYAGTITHWELWNEPNLGEFWEGTTDEYVTRVLVPGADAVHAACASCKVVGPGLATVGGKYDVWMDAALAAAKDKLDIVSGHVYASFVDLDSGAGQTSDSFLNKLEAHRKLVAAGSVIYEGPLSFKEVMDKHGVTKPFWLTETGREAKKGDAVAEAKQVTLYRRVLETMLTRPWWTNTIFYEAFDEPTAPYIWGVTVHDAAAPGGFSPKPAYTFLQKVTSSAPAFGGKKTVCDDGLDEDVDGAIDYPADTDCKSAAGTSEGNGPAGAGGKSGAGGASDGGAAGAAGQSGGGAGAGGAGDAADASDGGDGGGGCGCHVTTSHLPPSAWTLALVAALALLRRRAVPPARVGASPRRTL